MAERIRLLYIDDEAGLARLMQRALAPKGIDVEHALDGAEGLRRLDQGSIDIVALDHNLAAESGLDVLKAVRTRPGAPPVIYVTGSDDAKVAVAALKAGAVDYVWKDVEGHYRELLAEAVGTALAQENMRLAKERAERETREAKERAELLLREVNHRVANSLALVASLARLQANALTDEGAKHAIQEMQARVMAIASIHRRLYTSADVRFVEMDTYIRSLVSELSSAMHSDSRRHRIGLDIDTGMEVATDMAVSIGVVVAELVTNAYKYAYPAEVSGDIRVKLHRVAGDRMRLAVEDDGVGWAGTGTPRGTGLGSRIVKAMASSLRSSVEYDPAATGTRVMLEFSTAP